MDDLRCSRSATTWVLKGLEEGILAEIVRGLHEYNNHEKDVWALQYEAHMICLLPAEMKSYKLNSGS